MASTETRSGFRLPWSSDRAHDDAETEPTTVPAPEATDPNPAVTDVTWPETDVNTRPTIDNLDSDALGAEHEAGPTAEEPLMPDTNLVTSAPAVTPRKPSKLMSDLSAAIRATAEAARDQLLAQAEADARQAKETIREQSAEGAVALRQRSDEDVSGIRDWSKAEIARIREETDQKISHRKATLEEELSEHAASVERSVGDVDAEVARHQEAMDAYLERLRSEEDPARLATLAETMPEAPSFDAWLGTDAADAEAEAKMAADEEPEATIEPETVAEDVEPEATIEPETVAEDVEPEATIEPETVAEDGSTAWTAESDIIGQAPEADVAEGHIDREPEITAGEPEVEPTAETAGDDAEAMPEETVDGDQSEAPARPTFAGAWGDSDGDWTTPAPAAETDDVEPGARWAAGEVPEGFPAGDEAGDPVDRGAIMAALEAAAEAVVAADSAADSADHAEAAAGVAETAAELFRGRQESNDGEQVDPGSETGPIAADDESELFAGRLASLLPGRGASGDVDGEPQTSQIIASGLISVASIASFKRHLSRVPGVQAVSVASGPDGEFVFNVTHGPDVAFRDVLPALPGFAARVTSDEDGIVRVAAQDPETGS